MEVIVVIGGWDYEGEYFSSLRLFDSISKAEAYEKELAETYDYVKSERRVIEEVTFD